eukprot:s1301_g19.t1
MCDEDSELRDDEPSVTTSGRAGHSVVVAAACAVADVDRCSNRCRFHHCSPEGSLVLRSAGVSAGRRKAMEGEEEPDAEVPPGAPDPPDTTAPRMIVDAGGESEGVVAAVAGATPDFRGSHMDLSRSFGKGSNLQTGDNAKQQLQFVLPGDAADADQDDISSISSPDRDVAVTFLTEDAGAPETGSGHGSSTDSLQSQQWIAPRRRALQDTSSVQLEVRLTETGWVKCRGTPKCEDSAVRGHRESEQQGTPLQLWFAVPHVCDDSLEKIIPSAPVGDFAKVSAFLKKALGIDACWVDGLGASQILQVEPPESEWIGHGVLRQTGFCGGACEELGFDLPLKQDGTRVLVNVEENTEEIRKALVRFFDLEGFIVPSRPPAAMSNEKKRDVEERLRLAETYGDPELLAQVREEARRLGVSTSSSEGTGNPPPEPNVPPNVPQAERATSEVTGMLIVYF